MSLCFFCEYLADIPDSPFRQCLHPMTGLSENDPVDQVPTALLTAKETGQPAINMEAALALGIVPDYDGVKRGEFNWPYEFLPKYVQACTGRREKGGGSARHNGPGLKIGKEGSQGAGVSQITGPLQNGEHHGSEEESEEEASGRGRLSGAI